MPTRAYVPGAEWGPLSTFESGVHHLAPGQLISPAFSPLKTSLEFRKDVQVTLRDSTKIYVDLYLPPERSATIPVLVAWSPYSKSGGSKPSSIGLWKMLGIHTHTSGLEKFEGPDPDFWCAKGFAVCNPDPRGIGKSEGDAVMFGRQEGQDCYDLIEWLAVQDWCNGKVGMSGTSYLAASQWMTAAEQPPHLCAISPCEGFSDVYRELAKVGGMDDLAFVKRVETSFAGSGARESNAQNAIEHPLYSDFWKDKVPALDNITIPTYVVASYTNALHTPGTFRGWRGIASKEKWLRIHNTMEWPDYYSEEAKAKLLQFFERFLKGADNGWEKRPRVEYTLQDLEGNDRENIPATEFPPPGAIGKKLYLDGVSRTLVEGASKASTVEHDSEGWPGLISFMLTFNKETTIVGYPRLELLVEAEKGGNMDLFFQIQKLDPRGNHLQQFTVPGRSAALHDVTERGAPILRYKGPHGRLRVPMGRQLDADLSTEDVPVQALDKYEELAPGEKVPINVALAPCGLIFHPGEQLRLVISARNNQGPLMPDPGDFVPDNKGKHTVHCGGGQPSYLVLPVLEAST